MPLWRTASGAFLVLLAASMATARLAAAAEETSLKLVHAALPRSTAHMLFLRPWTQRLGALGGIRMTVEPIEGGDAAQAFAMLRSGQADLAWGPLARTGSADARAQVLELPFMAMSAEAMSQAARDLFAGPLADAAGDLHVIFAHADARAWLHTRDTPVRSLADLAGLRIHAPTTPARSVLHALGAEPEDAGSPAAAARGLAAGTLDGALLSFEAALPAGIIGETRYHTRIGRPADTELGIVPRPELASRVFVLAMTRARYEALSLETRAALDASTGIELANQVGRSWDSMEKHNMKTVREEGHVFYRVRESEVKRWRAAARPTIARWSAAVDDLGGDGAALLAEARTAVGRYEMLREIETAPSPGTTYEPGVPPE